MTCLRGERYKAIIHTHGEAESRNSAFMLKKKSAEGHHKGKKDGGIKTDPKTEKCPE